ncbi:MAG: hypothetical protein Kow006_30890 [Gammaproteobacteria bacterium]
MNDRRAGWWRLPLLTGLLMVLTLVVHLVYVAWPWPEAPRGTAPLQAAVAAEWSTVSDLAEGHAVEVIGSVASGTYQVLFVWTGLDYLVRRAADPTPMEGANEAGRRFVLGTWIFFETAYYSVQLLGLRLGVLAVSLPLFAVAGLGGFLDGLIGWYLRRTGGGRESGFIYHRAKFALWGAVFLLWACYLVPPVALDPRWLIPPFVVLFGLGVRVATAWFKKYL